MPEPTTWRSVLHGLAVWLAVALAVVLSSLKAGSRPEPKDKLAEDLNAQIQARYLVGLKAFNLPKDELVKQAKTLLPEGTKRAILLGEVDEPKRALAELPPEETALRRLYSKQALTDEEREAIAARGWFGRLALATMDEDREEVMGEARRTVVVFILMILGFILGIVLGLILLVLVVILVATGGLTAKSHEGRSLVYGETFAAYMLLYAGMGLGLTWVPIPTGWGLAINGAIMLLSLLALAWPVLRGVPWKTVKEDLGLAYRPPDPPAQPPRAYLPATTPATYSTQAPGAKPAPPTGRFWGDVVAGIATYFAALPLLAAGVLMMFVLTWLTRTITGTQPEPPSHPISGIALRSSPWWVWVQLFIVAAVLAPLVEEVFFRGALYTHLHRMGAGWSKLLRFLFATFLSSVLFAAIHPQGLLAIPPLAALATAFCLARELRGTLLPVMIAHGINNGLITLVMMLAIA